MPQLPENVAWASPAGRLVTAALALGTCFAAGCSEPRLGTVSGTIVVDGAPAEIGSIAFFPLDGQAATSGAAVEQGRYQAVVPLGKSKVEIRVSKVVGQKKLYDAPDSPVQAVMAEVLPPRYNDASELAIDVVPGPQQRDFDLTTR